MKKHGAIFAALAIYKEGSEKCTNFVLNKIHLDDAGVKVSGAMDHLVMIKRLGLETSHSRVPRSNVVADTFMRELGTTAIFL